MYSTFLQVFVAKIGPIANPKLAINIKDFFKLIFFDSVESGAKLQQDQESRSLINVKDMPSHG